MAIKIIVTVIGALVMGAGTYYLAKEKHDKESKKIYGIITAIGSIVFAVMLALTIFALI